MKAKIGQGLALLHERTLGRRYAVARRDDSTDAPADGLGTLPGVSRVRVLNGAVIADDDELLASAIPAGWEQNALRRVRRDLRGVRTLARPVHLDPDRLHVAIASPYLGFYPAMCVNLPRLLHLPDGDASEPVTVLLHGKPTAFDRYALERLLPEGSDARWLEDRQAYRVERLAIPPFFTDRFSSIVPSAYVSRLATATTEPDRSRRIYVSRKDASRRRVRNEQALVAALEPLGFESICAADLSVPELIDTFARADLVVGPHGAGLSYLIFSRPRRVVELHSVAPLFPHYLNLATRLGADYRAVVGDGVEHNSDFEVDVAQVVEAVEGASGRGLGP